MHYSKKNNWYDSDRSTVLFINCVHFANICLFQSRFLFLRIKFKFPEEGSFQPWVPLLKLLQKPPTDSSLLLSADLLPPICKKYTWNGEIEIEFLSYFHCISCKNMTFHCFMCVFVCVCTHLHTKILGKQKIFKLFLENILAVCVDPLLLLSEKLGKQNISNCLDLEFLKQYFSNLCVCVLTLYSSFFRRNLVNKRSSHHSPQLSLT